jgi:hypothetical protein
MLVVRRDELFSAGSWTALEQTKEERHRKEKPEAGWHGWGASVGVNMGCRSSW